MSRTAVRMPWGWATAGLVASCLLAVAIGSPLAGGPLPFSLPMGSPPKDIWNGAPPPRVAAKVTVTSGSVKVNSTVGGVTKLVAPVSAGIQCVFEGGFDKLSLEGVTPAEGMYEWRLMNAHTATDRVVGNGSISFPAGGGIVNVYNSDANARRMISTSAQGGSVALRSVRAGSDLVTIDDGDWSFAIAGNANAFYLSTTATPTAAFSIGDVSAPCGPFTGTARGTVGDIDCVSLDGTCPVTVALRNMGTMPVTVTSVLNGQVTNESCEAGATVTRSGTMSQFTWAYSGPQSTTVNLTLTIQ